MAEPHRFIDLKFKPHGFVGGALHARLNLPNGYAVSIVDMKNSIHTGTIVEERYECAAWPQAYTDASHDISYQWIEKKCVYTTEVATWLNEIAQLE